MHRSIAAGILAFLAISGTSAAQAQTTSGEPAVLRVYSDYV